MPLRRRRISASGRTGGSREERKSCRFPPGQSSRAWYCAADIENIE